MIKFESLLVPKDLTLKNAMKKLDQTAERILFVIDESHRLIGSLTDGDIRRWILSENNLDSKSEEACYKDFYYVRLDYDIEKVKEEVIQRRISHVPVLDDENRIVELLIWDDIFKGTIKRKVNEKVNLPVIIMAGGMGTRLEPFTKILPKPLIPIGDSSIIEVIINRFRNFGVNDFFITVRHKAKIIKSYFEELQPDYNVKFIYEDEPLGTIGSLRLMKEKLNGPFILTNCDILVDADYADIVKYHIENSFDITIIVSMKNYKIPYGICKTDGNGLLSEIQEKPELDFLINTGMYIINSSVIDYIPKNTHYDITQLIKKLKEDQKRVGIFPISESAWSDTGEWDEYKKTINKFLYDK